MDNELGSTHEDLRDRQEKVGSEQAASDSTHDIVILGGGAGGVALASNLKELKSTSITIIEPSLHQYDQPDWMRVATEGLAKDHTRRSQADSIPEGVRWIFDTAQSIDPDVQSVTTAAGDQIHYDYLVVAVGVECRWDQIYGLRETLGKNGICSAYGYENAEVMWEMIRSFEGGTAIFTTPPGPFKGGSAPLDIMHRAESYWADKGVRDDVHLIFATAGSKDFGGDTFEQMMQRDTEEDSLTVWPDHELIEIRGESKEAVFRIIDELTGSESVIPFDLLHVVPPMRAPEVISSSPLARQDEPLKGFLQVDPDTLRHTRYPNVLGIGDVAGVAAVKTGEHAKEQAQRITDALKDKL